MSPDAALLASSPEKEEGGRELALLFCVAVIVMHIMMMTVSIFSVLLKFTLIKHHIAICVHFCKTFQWFDAEFLKPD